MHCCTMFPAVPRFVLSIMLRNILPEHRSFAVTPTLLHRMNRPDGIYYITRTMQKDHRILTQSNTLSTTSLLEQMQSATVPQVRSRQNWLLQRTWSILSAALASITPCLCACTAGGSGGAPMEKLSDDVQTAHQGRFVRITIEQLGTIYGASLWEVRVFGLHV
eukprot:COSAG02_NODE_220_length_28426_cov_28.546863_19_plen_163_part_00